MFALHPPTGHGFLVLTLVLSSTTAFAQPPTVSLPDDIHIGDTVVISTLDGQSLQGRLASLSPAEITVLTRDGRRETLSAARVGRIVVKDPIRNGLIIGAGVGLAAGIAGAELVNTICENETGACPSVFFILGGIGAAAGAAIGAGIDGVRQRVALDLTPALPSEYSPEVFANMGGGLFATRGRRQPSSPSIGGSWLIRHSSGLALELDATRGLIRMNRAVPCVNSDGSRSGSVQGACVGSGEEGVSGTTTGAVKGIVLFLPRPQSTLRRCWRGAVRIDDPFAGHRRAARPSTVRGPGAAARERGRTRGRHRPEDRGQSQFLSPPGHHTL